MASDEMKSEASEAKRRRYDRQLRLWGAHGQEAMEECSVCLLNGSAVGTESLKNLVLPGIGSFTVVDGHTVELADLGSNFFLDEASLGKPRAECVTQMLRELNEHVAGSYVNEDIADVLEARPDFLTPFTLVIATQLPARELKRVGELCAARQIALVVAQTRATRRRCIVSLRAVANWFFLLQRRRPGGSAAIAGALVRVHGRDSARAPRAKYVRQRCWAALPGLF